MPLEAPRMDATMFRKLFRHHAGGAVVITLEAGARPAGFTATRRAPDEAVMTAVTTWRTM